MKIVDDDSGQELGVEIRAFLRHARAGVGDRFHVLNVGRIQEECKLCLAGLNQPGREAMSNPASFGPIKPGLY